MDCTEYADAPFCAGPSLKECPNGTEVPETEECGTAWLNDTDALGEPPSYRDMQPVPTCSGAHWTTAAPFCIVYVPDDEMYSCEETGECDDSCSPPARGDCLAVTEEPPPPPLDTLPETGAMIPTLAIVAGVAIMAGVRLIRGNQ